MLEKIVIIRSVVMQVSMFRWRGAGTGKGATFEHFCSSLFGEFNYKFCSMLRTFEFDHSEDWVHLNLTVQSTGSQTRVQGDAILEN